MISPVNGLRNGERSRVAHHAPADSDHLVSAPNVRHPKGRTPIRAERLASNQKARQAHRAARNPATTARPASVSVQRERSAIERL
jgi:hypothetical protein